MEYKYLLAGITWNATEYESDNLPESIIVLTSEKWSSDTEDYIIENIADEYLWEPLEYTREEITDNTEEDYCDLPEIIIK